MPKKVLLNYLLLLTICLGAYAQKESVNPGINKSYLNKDLVVEEWVERLEAEGREVFVNREAIVAEIGLKPGMAIADIGSGTGAHLPFMSKAVKRKGKVYAVDIVDKFLEHIDHQAEKNGWKNVETVLCTERSAELPANSIDVAFICNVYHHFEYPYDTLASLHQALRPGGKIVLVDFKRIPGESSDWILSHMRAGQDVFEGEILKSGFRKEREIKDLLKDNYMVIFQKVG
ncbi:MAG: methyltransferase domain-containing protein [Verrucomicrobiae bacterium]|nr:methyltransferase domain-containing protein [Verrucomicrobiae bacterium]